MEIKNIKAYAIVAALLFALGGLLACQKTNNNVSGVNRPVVEAYLVPGTKTLVKVYYQKYLDDTITYGYPIPGLKLSISDGTNTVQLAETTPGNYTWSDTTFVKFKKTYSLSFTYQGNAISAKTTVPDRPTGFKESDTLQLVPYRGAGIPNTGIFGPVTFSWDNPSSWYYMLAFKDVSTVLISTSANSRPYHDSEVVLGQTSTYQTQAMNFSYIGNYKILLYHINQEYSDAINASGGTSLTLSNPSTNVVNGLGIFTSMSADTLKLDVKLQ
jgi:hypothetical protein